MNLSDEEKEEIREALKSTLEVYEENLDDYIVWNKTKKDGYMSKFNQEECNEQIEYYGKKIEFAKNLISKIGVK